MAVGRYDGRRAAVVDDANAIGTAYLRAQTLREPIRSRRSPTSSTTPTPASAFQTPCREASGRERRSPRRTSSNAGSGGSPARRSDESPTDSAPRLYVDSLNDMIDMQTVRVAELANRVPTAVLVVEIFGAAVALGLLALYLAIAGPRLRDVLFAAVLVCLLLLITFDLDRPTRGLVEVPDTPLISLRASMALPPAAAAPR